MTKFSPEAVKAACETLSAELTANAEAIGAIMDEPLPGDEHEHYTVSYAFGRRQVIWSTKSECVVCGSGKEHR